MKSFFILLLGCSTIGLHVNSCSSTKETGTNDKLFYMDHGGRKRSYIVHLPPEAKMKEQVPLLFNLHGGGGNAKNCAQLTFGRFNTLSDRDGFIVVYPNGVDKNWNDGRPLEKSTAWVENVDDVGFIREIVAEMRSKYNIDANRIFTTGMSNGGFMSSRLLCDAADIFRGGAIVTAQISKDYLPKCNPEKPVAVMVMNGTADPLVPYNGGLVKVLGKTRGEIISTDDYIEFWKEKNGCIDQKSTIDLPNTDNDETTVSVTEYENCENDGALLLYRINNGGHTWPGGKQYLGERWIGKTNKDIIACDVIWDYFKNLE